MLELRHGQHFVHRHRPCVERRPQPTADGKGDGGALIRHPGQRRIGHQNAHLPFHDPADFARARKGCGAFVYRLLADFLWRLSRFGNPRHGRRILGDGRIHERMTGVTPPGIDPSPRNGHDAAMLVFKIFRRPEWDAFRAAGTTNGAPIDLVDGYIHLSTAAQVAQTAARHFAQESDLVLVAIPAEPLGADLKWDPARGGVLFPHLYRALRLSDIAWDKSLPLGATGHIFPEGLW